MIGEPHSLTTRECPYCHHPITACTGILADGTSAPDTPPQPGDVSLCINCAELVIYDENLEFRIPTHDELVAIMTGNPEIDILRRALMEIKRDVT